MAQDNSNSQSTVDEILVDARALQDPRFRFRGVGQHSTSLLLALRHSDWPNKRPRLVALTDHKAEPLIEQHRMLFDDVTIRRQRPWQKSWWFLSLSPMTHDPVWISDILLDPAVLKIAIFYDFIPLRHPHQYLGGLDQRADYLTGFAWLGRYDLFAAISRHSGEDLTFRRGIDLSKVAVTGVAVRNALEPRPGDAEVLFGERRYIVVSGGGGRAQEPRMRNRSPCPLAPARAIAPGGFWKLLIAGSR